MMASREYGKPLDQYLPHCEKCGETTFVLMPIRMSEFVLENWQDRMVMVAEELMFHCYSCGTAVGIKNLVFRRL